MGRQSNASGQDGMASIVVVSVLIVILTLISLGFARLVSRSATNAANRQFSASATYAAQSAINDVATYLQQYVAANNGSNFLPQSTTCNGPGSLIGSQGQPGPFYSDSDLAGNRSTAYTCLLLDPTPSGLFFANIPSLKSQVVKINTSAAAGALDKLMISWQPSCNSGNDPNCPTGYSGNSALFDEKTWNSNGGACKDVSNANANCMPLLRLSVYPISNGEPLSAAQSQSKTVFLYPQKPGGNIMQRNYTDISGDSNSFIDGSLIPVPCNQTGANFDPSSSDYTCNIVLGALSGAINPANTDSVYLRLTPIYSSADIKIRANDKFGDKLNFIGVQAVVDATAQTGNVSKRLKAWVNTSSLAPNSNGVPTDISPNSDSIPEQALRTAIALCKRETVYNAGNGFNNNNAFVGYEVNAVCHDGIVDRDPVPSMNLAIRSNNGADQGKVWPANPLGTDFLDSGANNTDNPQNPVQQATVYTGTGTINGPTASGNITIKWSAVDASTCNGTLGSAGWAGDKSGQMTFSGANSQGIQDLSPIDYYTEYDLQCVRPGAPGNSAVNKVYAWPYPKVAFNSFNATAGQGYSISWNVANSTSCTASGDAGANGAWTGSQSSSKTLATFTKDLGTLSWNDNSSKTYFITCADPINRQVMAKVTISTSSTTCDGNNPDCIVHENAPNCTANWNVVDNNNGTGTLSFNGACPPPPDNPLLGYYRFQSCSSDFVNAIQSQQPPGVTWNCGDGVGNSYSFSVGPGHYCAEYDSGADPWSWLASDGPKCYEVRTPFSATLSNDFGIWNNSPRCSSPGNSWDGTWWCRLDGKKETTGPPGTPSICADGSHEWTTCDFEIKLSGGSSTTATCQVFSQGYNAQVWKGDIDVTFNGTGRYGWGDTTSGGGFGPNPNTFYLSCTDDVTGQNSFTTYNFP